MAKGDSELVQGSDAAPAGGGETTTSTPLSKPQEPDLERLIKDAGGAVLLQFVDYKLAKQKKPILEITTAIGVLTFIFGIVQWWSAQREHEHKTAEDKARATQTEALDERRYKRAQFQAVLDRFLGANTDEARYRVISALRALPPLDDDEKKQVTTMLAALQTLIVTPQSPTPAAPTTSEADGSTDPATQLKKRSLEDIAEIQQKVGVKPSEKMFRLQIAQGAFCGELAKQSEQFKTAGYDVHVIHLKQRPRECALTIGRLSYQESLQSWVDFTGKRIKGFTNAVIVPEEQYGAEYPP